MDRIGLSTGACECVVYAFAMEAMEGRERGACGLKG